jgi:hypothetical protein
MKAIRAILIILPLVVFAGSANANSVILDGNFLNPIGTGNNLTPWSDWTNVGISKFAAPTPIPGNYARIPVGGDLFQRFGALQQGSYTLSFLAQNQSPWTAELVFAVQTMYGTLMSQVFAAGTAGMLSLASSSSFTRETLNFSIGPQTPFVANEFYFSNSYNYPAPEIANSINPPGTIINIADVSLTPVAVTPLPPTWTMMLIGLAGFGFVARRRKSKPALMTA